MYAASATAMLGALLLGCVTGGAASTGGGPSTPIGNDQVGFAAIGPLVTVAELNDFVTSGRLAHVELMGGNFEDVPDPVAGRVMARGVDGVTVEACGAPDVHFLVDAGGEVYAVVDRDVDDRSGLFEKRIMIRCGGYAYTLGDGQHFAGKLEISNDDGLGSTSGQE